MIEAIGANTTGATGPAEIIGIIFVIALLVGMAKFGFWMISGPSLIKKSKGQPEFRETNPKRRNIHEAQVLRETETRASNMNHCISCGTKIAETDKFCGGCGQKTR